MLYKIVSDNILFIDIETVPLEYAYNDLSEDTRELWDAKTRFLQQRDDRSAEDVYEQAGIYAEFSKIVCISVGYVRHLSGERTLRVTSFADDDEKVLLERFARLISDKFPSPSYYLCGHNIKEFDVPFICRRMLVNCIKLPAMLNLAGKKPWEIPHLDTMELWKFGDYKHYTSLNLLTHIFGIPSPKDEISGADVARVYYEEKDLPKIVRYCEKDVVAVAQLLFRMKGENCVDQKNVVVV